ncbi:MAG: hypothetical protein NTY19_51675 [Planctomycetota bacterium]|nr:hypothetical protein [Planctomycetota bacterium]
MLKEIEVVIDGRPSGRQKVRLAGPAAAFKIMSISDDATEHFEDHTRRFQDHTRLQAIHWINVTREVVTFKTIQKKVTKKLMTKK